MEAVLWRSLEHGIYLYFYIYSGWRWARSYVPDPIVLTHGTYGIHGNPVFYREGGNSHGEPKF